MWASAFAAASGLANSVTGCGQVEPKGELATPTIEPPGERLSEGQVRSSVVRAEIVVWTRPMSVGARTTLPTSWATRALWIWMLPVWKYERQLRRLGHDGDREEAKHNGRRACAREHEGAAVAPRLRRPRPQAVPAPSQRALTNRLLEQRVRGRGDHERGGNLHADLAAVWPVAARPACRSASARGRCRRSARRPIAAAGSDSRLAKRLRCVAARIEQRRMVMLTARKPPW